MADGTLRVLGLLRRVDVDQEIAQQLVSVPVRGLFEQFDVSSEILLAQLSHGSNHDAAVISGSTGRLSMRFGRSAKEGGNVQIVVGDRERRTLAIAYAWRAVALGRAGPRVLPRGARARAPVVETCRDDGHADVVGAAVLVDHGSED